MIRLLKKPEFKISVVGLNKDGLNYLEQIFLSFFTGLSPIASGTISSILACLIYYFPLGRNFYFLIFLSLSTYLLGIKPSQKAEKFLGKDPSFVTIDEASGMWLTMASPFIIANIYYVFICFVCFRFFDIVKVFPSNYFDKRKGGFGIMTDDIFAGIYANICSHLIWIGLSWFPIFKHFFNN